MLEGRRSHQTTTAAPAPRPHGRTATADSTPPHPRPATAPHPAAAPSTPPAPGCRSPSPPYAGCAPPPRSPPASMPQQPRCSPASGSRRRYRSRRPAVSACAMIVCSRSNSFGSYCAHILSVRWSRRKWFSFSIADGTYASPMRYTTSRLSPVCRLIEMQPIDLRARRHRRASDAAIVPATGSSTACAAIARCWLRPTGNPHHCRIRSAHQRIQAPKLLDRIECHANGNHDRHPERHQVISVIPSPPGRSNPRPVRAINISSDALTQPRNTLLFLMPAQLVALWNT